MAHPVFTTREQVERRLSATGVELRIDHSPTNAFEEAALAASLDVSSALGMRYGVAMLVGSEWVASVTADICIWYLDQWRDNPVGGSIQARWEQRQKEMQDIAEGKKIVPDISMGRNGPEVLKQRIAFDRYPAQRTTRADNTGYRPAGKRYPDITEPPDRG
jgi:hypothetical protein